MGAVMSEEDKEEYMATLWKRIMNEDTSEIVVECTLLNFESKIQLGWPDPRKYW